MGKTYWNVMSCILLYLKDTYRARLSPVHSVWRESWRDHVTDPPFQQLICISLTSPQRVQWRLSDDLDDVEDGQVMLCHLATKIDVYIQVAFRKQQCFPYIYFSAFRLSQSKWSQHTSEKSTYIICISRSTDKSLMRNVHKLLVSILNM